MNILAIIPARGGSKGIHRKNVKLLAGKPLIFYSIESALNSRYITKVIVSTEDKEIKDISMKYGSEVIDRPKELAIDNSSTINVIIHSLSYLEKNEKYIPDIVIVLQPTSPLRMAEDIDNSIKIFINKDAESVISVCELEHSPYWSLKIENDYLKPAFGQKYLENRRQELPKLYIPNGAIFISKPQTLKVFRSFQCKKTLPYIMPHDRSIDIDNQLDFILTEFLIKRLEG